MRRRVPPKSSSTFSLFPFLAVLMCTMGSLVVLLLIVVNRAHVNAEEAKKEPRQDAAAAAQLLAAREEQLREKAKYESLASQLDEAQKNWADRVAAQRLELSHLEDHALRLREQLAKLEAEYKSLEQLGHDSVGSREEKLARLHDLQQAIRKAKLELDEAKVAASNKKRSYSIIPYDGPQGTRRRPIYIECCRDRIVIQPEGTVLFENDFTDATDVGNPLAAALRATREYLARTGTMAEGEPYPLLLVRPDGAEMYSAARNAMSSWSSEYGYELIDADMVLEMPPADEALGDVVRRTVELARQRQVRVAVARGGIGGSRGGTGGGIGAGGVPGDRIGGQYFSASQNGGFEMHGGDSGDFFPSSSSRSGSAANPYGGEGTANATSRGGIGGAPRSTPVPGGISGNNGSVNNGEQPIGGFYGSRPPAAGSGFGGDGTGTGTGTGSGTGTGTGSGSNVNQSHGQAQVGPGGPHNAGSSQQQANNANQNGSSSNQSSNTAQGAGTGGGRNYTPGADGQLAQGQPGGMPSSGAPGGYGTSIIPTIGSPDESGPPGEAAPNNRLDLDSNATPPQGMASIASKRGDNWALPNSAQGSTSFARPIRIECHLDRLVILPDKGTTFAPKVTKLNGPMEPSVDQFVGQVWNHMRTWGIAGPRAYWKPVLLVEVAPDAEYRFAEFAALMHASGLDVERKEAP